MEAPHEKTYRSPPRKLVKFFERSRDQWKAKSRAAKTARKRLGTRLRRVEERNATYQQQLAALQTQVAEWQAKHEQTARELEAVKKNGGRWAGTADGGCAGEGGRAASSL
jgi:lipopolysaccharide export system protein LptC